MGTWGPDRPTRTRVSTQEIALLSTPVVVIPAPYWTQEAFLLIRVIGVAPAAIKARDKFLVTSAEAPCNASGVLLWIDPCEHQAGTRVGLRPVGYHPVR
jgi:hypothetical protein